MYLHANGHLQLKTDNSDDGCQFTFYDYDTVTMYMKSQEFKLPYIASTYIYSAYSSSPAKKHAFVMIKA